MTASEIDEIIKRAANWMQKARYAVVFTGAGISTPSGIPDFRGEKNGLWQRYDPMRVASHSAFIHTPGLFYDWFRPLFLTSWTAQPNQAHLGLAKLEESGFVKAVITQNIDGLHQKAGSRRVFELHGSAMLFTCPGCGAGFDANSIHQQFAAGILLPTCERCHQVLKPDVVLFEEVLAALVWQEAEDEVQKADLLLVIGSSLEVFPACTLPQQAIRQGSRVIINNLTPTPLDRSAAVVIPMDAAKFVPRLVELILSDNTD